MKQKLLGIKYRLVALWWFITKGTTTFCRTMEE